MMHKPAMSSWVRPTSNFLPAPELGRPPGGSSPVIHFFREQETGARWIGKCGQVPLRDKEVIATARRLPGFLGVYADEILEKLGLAVYQMLGTEAPESALSYQQVTMEAMHPDMLLAMQLNAEDEGRVFELPHSPRMHYLSRYVDEFQPLDKDFVEHYLANAKRCGNQYVKIQTRDGEMLPLRGLGSMLAAADFVYDLDCLGDSCGNAGYVIKEDVATGERYAQLVKIDAGYAFSYSELRTDQTHNPRDRQIRVAPNQLRLQFADLAPVDQREFATTAKRILAIPYEAFAHLFSQTEEIQEGLSMEHWLELLNGLIARKSLFLKAFAPETDRTIVKEIEAAQAKIAKKFEHTEEVSPKAVEELLEQEKEDAIALAELRVRLAVVDVKESEVEKAGECKTFQLPSTTTHFVGREEALAQVASQLNQANGSVIGQSISGIGGVGKTQLALHYAQAAVNGEVVAGQHLAYDYVVWLNAEVFLEGQFQAMAEVWTGEHLKADEAVEAVYRFLRGKRTLLVFDNAENARSIAAFLPPAQYANPVHFLITSRSAQWGEIPTVKLGGFSLEEAQEYVEYHLGRQSEEAVKKLVELLEGLPLAMSQAVSYIKAGHCTLQSFEEQFYLNQANLLSHELILEEAHPKTVGTTLTLSLAQAKVQSREAERLLGIAAYLAPDNIQIELIVRALEINKEEAEQAIGVLENYSLLNRVREGIQVHRLVQEVMRHRHKFLNQPQSYWEKALELFDERIIYDETNMEKVRSCIPAIPHVQQLSKLATNRKLNKEQESSLWMLIAAMGYHQLIMGNYRAGRSCQEQVLEIVERHFGPDHVMVAMTLDNLGIAYNLLGNARMQVELSERSLPILMRYFGPDHPQLAKTLLNLGIGYGSLGKVHLQKELLERALVIQERHLGRDHLEVAKVLINLGNAYGDLGDARKQKELMKRALIIQKHNLGIEHPDVASSLVNLSNAYANLGNVRKQKELLVHALSIKEQHFGPDHPEVAKALLGLGNAYGDLGDASKQKELLERALVINECHFGPESVAVAKTLVNLGNAYGDLGDASKQKNLLKRALIIKERHFGPHHPEVARALVGLSSAYGDLGYAQTQKELLERALVIDESHFGSEHPMVASTLSNLGNAYGTLGDICKQKELLERALTIKQRYFGSEHPMVVGALTNLAIAYGELGKPRKKKELSERALNIQERYYGTSHPNIAASLFNLAHACVSLGEFNYGKEYAQKAFSIFSQYYGKEHPNTQKAEALLQKCEEASGRNPTKEKEEAKEKEATAYHPTLTNVINESDLLMELSRRLQSDTGLEDQKVMSVNGDEENMRQQWEFLERKLSSQEKQYGADQPEITNTLLNLAKVYYKGGNKQKSRELLERALKIQEEHLDSEHLEVGKTMSRLGKVYIEIGALRSSEEFLERAITIFETHYGLAHLKVAKLLVKLGNVCGDLGDIRRQKDSLTRALKIEEKNYGPDNIKMGLVLYCLANACLNSKEYAEASAYVKRIYSIYKLHYGEGHQQTEQVGILLRKCQENELAAKATARMSNEKEKPKRRSLFGIGRGRRSQKLVGTKEKK